jgi:hypothetical protein
MRVRVGEPSTSSGKEKIKRTTWRKNVMVEREFPGKEGMGRAAASNHNASSPSPACVATGTGSADDPAEADKADKKWCQLMVEEAVSSGCC